MLIKIIVVISIAIFFIGCGNGSYDNKYNKKVIGGYNDSINE